MKLILEPTVTIISSPRFHPHPSLEIPDDGDDIIKIGSFAAKGCYDSYGKDGRSNFDNQTSILNHKHGSVLEHLYFGLHISGITRACSLELNRHRHFAISQRSTRYTDESKEPSIVLEPYLAEIEYKCRSQDPSIYPSPHELAIYDYFIESCEKAFEAYKEMVDLLVDKDNSIEKRKWARGMARNVLPHALETSGVWTGNIRAWRWFIESRSSVHAEPEIQRLARKVIIKLHSVAPLYFEDFYGEYGPRLGSPKYSKI